MSHGSKNWEGPKNPHGWEMFWQRRHLNSSRETSITCWQQGKIFLGMTTWKIELDARLFKAARMRIKTRIEKERELLSYIIGKNMLKVIIGEATKDYKKKKTETERYKICINMHN